MPMEAGKVGMAMLTLGCTDYSSHYHGEVGGRHAEACTVAML